MYTFVFKGLSKNQDDLDMARLENAAYTRRRAAFHEEFSQLGNGNPTLKELRKFVFEDHKLNDFQSSELMQILTAFRLRDGFQDVLDIIEESNNKDFKEAQIVREFYAVACNKTGQYNKTIEVCDQLIRDGLANGEIYAALGKAHLRVHNIARSYLQASEDFEMPVEAFELCKKQYLDHFPDDTELENAEENAEISLLRSKANYEAGFLIAFEYYPGINTVHRMIELEEFDNAKRVARMVHMACLRDGARETMDYLCATTLMEAACIRSANTHKIKEATEIFLNVRMEKKQLEATVRTLEKHKRNMGLHDQDTSAFDYPLKQLHTALKHYGRMNFNVVARKKKETVTSALLKASFNYRGLASHFSGAHFVPGNIQYGGQLPDHYLSRSDWQQFGELLETPLYKLIGKEEAANYPPTLKDILCPDDFLAASDKIIRRAFGTNEYELEELQSAGHKKYDETVKALFHLSGLDEQKNADSRTNISVIMGLGLGDCRHHAQAKQILFDAWQKNQMNSALNGAYEELKKGNIEKHEQYIAEFKDIESIELRTMDIIVQAPIQTDGMYAPKQLENGYAILELDGHLNEIEEHTFNILLKHDKKGALKSIRFADSFYQNHYDWQDGNIPVSTLKLDHDKKIVLPAKHIMAFHPDSGHLTMVPLQMRPTVYTGKRDEVSREEHGKLLLLGIPVEIGFNLAEKLAENRAERAAPLERMHDWYIAEKTSTPKPRKTPTPSA